MDGFCSTVMSHDFKLSRQQGGCRAGEQSLSRCCASPDPPSWRQDFALIGSHRRWRIWRVFGWVSSFLLEHLRLWDQQQPCGRSCGTVNMKKPIKSFMWRNNPERCRQLTAELCQLVVMMEKWWPTDNTGSVLLSCPLLFSLSVPVTVTTQRILLRYCACDEMQRDQTSDSLTCSDYWISLTVNNVAVRKRFISCVFMHISSTWSADSPQLWHHHLAAAGAQLEGACWTGCRYRCSHAGHQGAEL